MHFLSSTVAFVVAVSTVAAQYTYNPQQPTANGGTGVTLRTTTPLGCFSDPGDMWDMGPYTFQTNGWCQPLCVRQSATYFALVNGTNCFCGNSAPESKYSAPSSECDVSCNGDDQDDCGGVNRWAVFADGFRNGDNTGTVSISTITQTWFGHAATSTQSTLHTTTGPNTIVVTASAFSQPTTTVAPTSSGGGGPNKAAIVAGAVVGIVGLAAIIGAATFYIRTKKRRELEDERRRHESIIRIVNNKAEKANSFAGSDERLDPTAMFQKRESTGSIMDNQDYSRRILKVTNPDWRSSRA